MLAVALASSLIIGACSAQEVPEEEFAAEVVDETSAEQEPVEPEPPRIPPEWEQSVSTADFSRCKLDDPRPADVKLLYRGQKRGDIIGRDNVGFPRTEREIPGLGEGNIISAKVSFLDAPPSDRVPEGFLEEQTAVLTEWSEFWSQGKFRYTFQLVEDWVEVPINHADYPIDPGVGDNEYDQEEFEQQMQARQELIAKAVVGALPDDLDYAAADAIFVYFSPEISAFQQSVGSRGTQFDTPDGYLRIPFSGGGIYHYSDAGGMPFSIKQPYMWTWWVHDILHFQGMNGHAPGNGWKTGVGQGAYPANGMFSGALTAWETFLFEWLDDEQVHCADIETLSEPERVMLTPLEIYGGERKMIAIRTVDYKVLVVESRRPIGWSEEWDPKNSGLLVYEVDADGTHTDHVPNDCGNDPANPKWAYYLYPDGNDPGGCVMNDIDGVLVREGMTLTHSGVKISFEYSGDDKDYVLIERVIDAN